MICKLMHVMRSYLFDIYRLVILPSLYPLSIKCICAWHIKIQHTLVGIVTDVCSNCAYIAQKQHHHIPEKLSTTLHADTKNVGRFTISATATTMAVLV